MGDTSFATFIHKSFIQNGFLLRGKAGKISLGNETGQVKSAGDTTVGMWSISFSRVVDVGKNV